MDWFFSSGEQPEEEQAVEEPWWRKYVLMVTCGVLGLATISLIVVFIVKMTETTTTTTADTVTASPDYTDYCLDNPCENNGTCVNGINNYRCVCLPCFGGRNCTNTGKDFIRSDQFEDSVYCASRRNLTVSYKGLKQRCEDINGYLAELNSQAEYNFTVDFLKTKLETTLREDAFLGATNLPHSRNVWRYTTSGVPLSWQQWAATGSENCMWIVWNDANYEGLHQYICDDPKKYVHIVCEVNQETNQTYKYAYNPKPQTFQEARHDCGIRGLTMPKTEAELTRLVGYMDIVANTTNVTIWVGLTDSDGSNTTHTFEWLDGTPLKYGNWKTLDPATGDRLPSGGGYCVSIGRGDDWRFTDMDCSAKLSSVCQYPDNIIHVTTSSPTQTTHTTLSDGQIVGYVLGILILAVCFAANVYYIQKNYYCTCEDSEATSSGGDGGGNFLKRVKSRASRMSLKSSKSFSRRSTLLEELGAVILGRVSVGSRSPSVRDARSTASRMSQAGEVSGFKSWLSVPSRLFKSSTSASVQQAGSSTDDNQPSTIGNTSHVSAKSGKMSAISRATSRKSVASQQQ